MSCGNGDFIFRLEHFEFFKFLHPDKHKNYFQEFKTNFLSSRLSDFIGLNSQFMRHFFTLIKILKIKIS